MGREWEKLLREVGRIARQAGELVLSMEHPEVTAKDGHANFVTEADIASQEFIMEQLKKLLPEAGFLAEEGEDCSRGSDLHWIIDPIDGTTNFMRGFRHSAISIALTDGTDGLLGAVWNPYMRELFHAVKGGGAFVNEQPVRVADTPPEQSLVIFGSSPYYRELAGQTFDVVKRIFLRCGDIRRSGSAALDLCYLAAGRCDGFYEARLSPWDFAAASVIIREAGGVISAGGLPLLYDHAVPVCAGNFAVHQMILEEVQK